jgi:hypothetical protein
MRIMLTYPYHLWGRFIEFPVEELEELEEEE